MYDKGQGVPQDDVRAYMWFSLAAAQCNATPSVAVDFCAGLVAKKNLGRLTQRMTSAQIAEAQKLARAWKPTTQLERQRGSRSGSAVSDAAGPLELVATALARGDYVTVAKLLRPLANQGNADAQANVGLMYATGQGVQRDDVEAVKWFRMAAEQGVAEAQKNLGLMYLNGRGVQLDSAQAMMWFQKAGLQGHAQAQYNVAVAYERGDGVAQSFAEAVKWFRFAADQGDAEAQYSLGKRYRNGEGVTRDYSEAVKWFRRAAEQGVADAQNDLGVEYAGGRGVPKDVVQAYMWASLSAAQGNAGSNELRKLVAKEMKPAQIAEAENLFRNWRRK
jgi:TPR repeat protein